VYGYSVQSPDEIPEELQPDHEVELTGAPPDPTSGTPPAFIFDPTGMQVACGDIVQFTYVTPDHTVTAYEDGFPDGAAYFASGGYDTEAEARREYENNNGGLLDQGDRFEHEFPARTDLNRLLFNRFGWFCGRLLRATDFDRPTCASRFVRPADVFIGAWHLERMFVAIVGIVELRGRSWCPFPTRPLGLVLDNDVVVIRLPDEFYGCSAANAGAKRHRQSSLRSSEAAAPGDSALRARPSHSRRLPSPQGVIRTV